MNTVDAPSAAGLPRRMGRTFLRAVKAVAWWFNSILGGNDYQRYVQHLTLRHPDAPVPTERDYWRERHAAAAKNPANRCC